MCVHTYAVYTSYVLSLFYCVYVCICVGGTPDVTTPTVPVFAPFKPHTSDSSPPRHTSHTSTPASSSSPPSSTNITLPSPPLSTNITLPTPHSSHTLTDQSDSVSQNFKITQSVANNLNILSSVSTFVASTTEEESEQIKYNLRRRNNAMSASNLKPVEHTPVDTIDVSDDEIDYDSYLDQLEEMDDENSPVAATGFTSTLALTTLLQEGLPKLEVGDPFSEDFPAIDQKKEKDNESLLALVGGEVEKKPKGSVYLNMSSAYACIYIMHVHMYYVLASIYYCLHILSLHAHVESNNATKSSKKKEKELTWKAKQRQRQVVAKETTSVRQPRPPCKYFMNGMCKNVSIYNYDYVCNNYWTVIIVAWTFLTAHTVELIKFLF